MRGSKTRRRKHGDEGGAKAARLLCGLLIVASRPGTDASLLSKQCKYLSIDN